MLPGVYELHPYHGRLHMLFDVVWICSTVLFEGHLPVAGFPYAIDQWLKIDACSLVQKLRVFWSFMRIYMFFKMCILYPYVFLPLAIACILSNSLSRFEVSLAFPCWRFTHSSTSSMLLTHRQAWHSLNVERCVSPILFMFSSTVLC